ncbi:MAG: hypothetical protein HUJ92_09730 [Bacteroidales bacterium]|nr:hypothetical protein [Bacteroidales bacterium]
MNRRYYIRITPDYDILYDDMKGCSYSAYGDEVYNSEPSLGPMFRFAVPGIEEWLKRYEDATDFAETTTYPDFDWKSWHWEGLQFAKYIRERLPLCYDLYYNSPYEDKSGTLDDEILVDDTIDQRISSLGKYSSFMGKACSREDNVKIEIENKDDKLHITLSIRSLTATFDVLTDDVKILKQWLENIAKGVNTSECYLFGDKNLFFFPQKIGIHPEMGTLWVMSRCNSELSAYVNRQEFVKAFYSILFTKLGLCHNTSASTAAGNFLQL